MSHIIVKLKVKQETNMSFPEIGRLFKEVSTLCFENLCKRSIDMWPDILQIISPVILKVGLNQQQSVLFNTSLKMK